MDTETLQRAALFAATVLSGLFAGLFATFSYAVLPGLRRTDDTTFVRAMQQINTAILNPVFALVFAGTVIATLSAAAVAVREAGPRPWVIASLALVLATVVVTMAVSVPLNDRLAEGTGSAAALREAFEGPWVAWNVVRSALSAGGFGCAVLALAALG
jgi:uncharacterized membrane protein